MLAVKGPFAFEIFVFDDFHNKIIKIIENRSYVILLTRFSKSFLGHAAAFLIFAL